MKIAILILFLFVSIQAQKEIIETRGNDREITPFNEDSLKIVSYQTELNKIKAEFQDNQNKIIEIKANLYDLEKALNQLWTKQQELDGKYKEINKAIQTINRLKKVPPQGSKR